MIEDVVASAIVKALMAAIRKGKDYTMKRGAKKNLGEAIMELVKINPNTDLATANIAVAKAAGIINMDLFTAERLCTRSMPRRHPWQKAQRVLLDSKQSSRAAERQLQLREEK